MKWYIDGFTIGGNPSSVGGGFTVLDENNKLIKQEQIFKEKFTCNEGELLGMLYATKIASENDTIITDSKNTIFWVKSGRPKARPDLTQQASEAKEMIEQKNLIIEWCGRDKNLAGIYNDKPRVYSF